MTKRKIYDSVHRFIHLTPIENALISSYPFQRLRYIHQLGVTFFVYPGAVHKRFEHSLGAMELASRMYDRVTQGIDRGVCDEGGIPYWGSPSHQYWRSILRLSALCHDLGHLPFSHVGEKKLLSAGGHEKWTAILIKSSFLAPVWERFRESLQGEMKQRDVVSDLVKIALGPKSACENLCEISPFTPWERVLSEMLTGDFFGADRIDYLLRDAQCTGLAYGCFDYDQLFETLKIFSMGECCTLCLGVEENGMESCEALLLSRHYMHKRVYQYPAVKGYSFHLARFMQKNYGDLEQGMDRYLEVTDNEVLVKLREAACDRDHPGHVDGAALWIRKPKVRAMQVSGKWTESELVAIREELGLSSEEMSWELALQKPQRGLFSFPVLRRDGARCLGESISGISVHLHPTHWVFVEPTLASLVEEKMEKRLQECSLHPWAK